MNELRVTDQKEFARRRKQLMRMMGKGALAILPAATIKFRNRDAEYPYRQDSDFYYLTGFAEADSVAVLAPGREHGEYILFSQERDRTIETWTGRRAGQDGAIEYFGADDAFPINDIDDVLPGLLEQCDRVYYTMGCDPDFDGRVLGWVNHIRQHARGGARTPGEFIALEHHLHDMRLYKSRAEIKCMERAAEVSVAAHKRAMRVCKPGMREYELEAEYLHEFRCNEMQPAYTTIVGGGGNACVLHYTANSAKLRDDDLVLIDAGGECDHYAADITRTFPVNGRFSAAQREVYEIVLAAQMAAIDQVRPGNCWNDPHRAAVRVLTEGMVELGLLKGAVDALIEDESYRRFYMHRTGHWLGMDVHDVGDYKVGGAWRQLEPGMVLTVEPGLYIPAKSKGVRKRYWDIGIRIEDDVLVTKDGCKVLTDGAPKTVADIEAWMAG
ncbi:MAG: Xaa-Pro aminopeptidase [Gammaproteobacteria bacterium]|nr:Xaa-Pro aminopeptidase [Gammaproteobacteria bacterium]MCP5136985.1 Xaa-Pro aminopeptidase [Gammaproteobacteria bacterium]